MQEAPTEKSHRGRNPGLERFPACGMALQADNKPIMRQSGAAILKNEEIVLIFRVWFYLTAIALQSYFDIDIPQQHRENLPCNAKPTTVASFVLPPFRASRF